MKRKSKNGELPNKRIKSNSRGRAGVASVSVIIFLLDKFGKNIVPISIKIIPKG